MSYIEDFGKQYGMTPVPTLPDYVKDFGSTYNMDPVDTSINVAQDLIKPKQSFGHKVLNAMGSFVKGATKPVVTELVRPVQAVKSVISTIKDPLKEPDLSVNLPFYGKIGGPTTLKHELGTAAQTVALGLGATAGAGAFGLGDALEKDKGVVGTVVETLASMLAGRIVQHGFDKVAPLVSKVVAKYGSPVVSKLSELLPEELIPALQKLSSKVTSTKILPEGVSRVVNEGAEKIESGATKIADKALSPITKTAKTTKATYLSLKEAISPDVESALTRAIKPGKNNSTWSNDLKTSLPHIQETAELNKRPVKNLDDLNNGIKDTKKRFWQNYKDQLGPNAKATVDGNQVADAMLSAVDKRYAAQNPRGVERIIEKANTYRRPLTLDEAEEFLQSVNGDLNSYYAKNKVGQNIAEKDPEVGYVVKEGEALREVLYNKLGELTGKDAAEIKQTYGALTNLQKEVAGRINVAARQNPASLAQQYSRIVGVGKMAKSALNLNLGDAVEGGAQVLLGEHMRNLNDPDYMIEHAFSKLAARGEPLHTEISNFNPPKGGAKPNVNERVKEIQDLMKEKKVIKKDKGGIPKNYPKELEPLAQEARKYKSAEEFVKAQAKPRWSELQKTNPELFQTGVLRKSQAPYKAVGEIPQDIHTMQGKWQNYGQYDEVPADVVYKRIDRGSFKGEYVDSAGNPVRDKTGRIIQDTYDEATGEYIKPTISNQQLKDNLLEKFSTKEGKDYLNKVITALPKNPDGSITAYRIGSIGEGRPQSYTLSEGMAKTFSNQGTDILPPGTPGLPKGGYKDFGVLPANVVKIDPKGIVAWSPYDAEILVEPKYVKTKSQLTDFYNQVTRKVKKK